jgi:hypothetical protein
MNTFARIFPPSLDYDPTSKLSAAEHGHLSDSLLKPRGDRLRYLLERKRPSSGVGSILYLGTSLALSARAWNALQAISFPVLRDSEMLFLAIAMPRHRESPPLSLVPNFWRGKVEECDHQLFVSLDDDGFILALAAELDDDLITFCFRSRLEVFMALEASLTAGFSQDHIAILAGVTDVGMPATIDLDNAEIPKPKRRYPVEDDDSVVEGRIMDFLSALRTGRQSKRAGLKGTVRMIKHEIASNPNDPQLQVMEDLFMNTRPKREFPGKEFTVAPKHTKLVSLETKAASIPKIWRYIQNLMRDGVDQTPTVKLDRNERKVLELFYGVLENSDFPDEFIEKFQVERLVAVREFHLRHPLVYQRYYDLENAPPTIIDDLISAAKRILRCFLYYSGRRAACIALMTLGDLRHVEEAFIRYTKSRSQVKGWSPIFFLWPESELAHLRKFLLAAAHLPSSYQLLQVANLGWELKDAPTKGRPSKNLPYTKVNVDLAQQAMRRGLIPGRDISTHLGRINLATFWTLRIWAVQYPFLLKTPLYQKLLSHFWFRTEGLDKIGLLVDGSFHYHRETLRIIMGLSSTEQIFHTYNRGWPLEFTAWSDILAYLRSSFASLDQVDLSSPAKVAVLPSEFRRQQTS